MTIDMSVWQGRVDSEDNDAGLRFHQMVKPLNKAQKHGIVLLGFATDEGVKRNKGRIGAAKAPAIIRGALANLPWHHTLPIYDSGNVKCLDGDLVSAQRDMANHIEHALDNQHFPFVIGGGHEIAWASFQGLAQHCLKNQTSSAPSIGIINFDAHFDLRTPFGDAETGSSGTPFSQIAQYCFEHQWPFQYACLGVSRSSNTLALFNKADELSVLTVEDSDISPDTFNTVRQSLTQFMAKCDHLYLTIDMDVFPASTAPGVSAPATHGVSFPLVEGLIKEILQARDSDGKQKLKLADIAETNPLFDIDNQTSRIAARLVWTITRGLSPMNSRHTNTDLIQVNHSHDKE